MPSEKLIRCVIRPAGSRATGSTRYVPLEIFGLWEHLMRARHGFEVLEPRASLWLDMEDGPDSAYEEHQFERVTEIQAFVYSGRDEMFARCSRFFPSEECARLKEIFLSHYRGEDAARLRPPVRERPGIWLHRPEPVPPTRA